MISSYDLNTKKISPCNDSHLQKIWNQFLIFAEKDAGKRVVDSWFRSLIIFSWNYKFKIITVIAPNQFVKDWIEKNYINTIQNCFGKTLEEDSISVNLVLSDEKHDSFIYGQINKNIENKTNSSKIFHDELIQNKESKLECKNISNNNKIQKKNYFNSTINKIKFLQSSLNKNFTFENFIYGPENDFVYFSAKELVENKNSWHNVFFIHGPSGMGKTHIMHAIGHDLISKKIPFLYQTSDKFINDYIDAAKSNLIDKFEKMFDHIEVFLIDDIQIIAEKLKTQEIFLKIFTILSQKEKKIIITGNKSPRNLNGLNPRLISRIEGGLILDLNMPSIDTVINIIINKSKHYKVDLTKDMAELIAVYASSNIREIEGVIIKIATVLSINKDMFSLEYLHKILSSVKSVENKDIIPLEISIVIKYVCKNFKITLEEICSGSREKKFLFPRYIVIYIVRIYLNYSYREIAKMFGYKDHTTIIYIMKKIKYRSQELASHLESIKDEFSKHQLKFFFKK